MISILDIYHQDWRVLRNIGDGKKGDEKKKERQHTLSASGSRYEPSTELMPNFLATNPSS
jgi:hypothetical protein